jgi:hypothetical protein
MDSRAHLLESRPSTIGHTVLDCLQAQEGVLQATCLLAGLCPGKLKDSCSLTKWLKPAMRQG